MVEAWNASDSHRRAVTPRYETPDPVSLLFNLANHQLLYLIIFHAILFPPRFESKSTSLSSEDAVTVVIAFGYVQVHDLFNELYYL